MTRPTLTALGVIIGSASIVLVVTVALTSKKFVLSQIEGVGSNLVWVELVRRPDTPQPLSYEMTLEDMESVRAIPNVIEVAGTREMEMTVILDGVERPVHLVGVTDGYQAIRRLLILRGRYFDSGDEPCVFPVSGVNFRRRFSDRTIRSGKRCAWEN